MECQFWCVVRHVCHMASSYVLYRIYGGSGRGFAIRLTGLFHDERSVRRFRLSVRGSGIRLEFMFVSGLVSVKVGNCLRHFLVLYLMLVRGFFRLFYVRYFVFCGHGFSRLGPPPAVFLCVVGSFFVCLGSLLHFVWLFENSCIVVAGAKLTYFLLSGPIFRDFVCCTSTLSAFFLFFLGHAVAVTSTTVGEATEVASAIAGDFIVLLVPTTKLPST